jgi:hypothetical protein
MVIFHLMDQFPQRIAKRPERDDPLKRMQTFPLAMRTSPAFSKRQSAKRARRSHAKIPQGNRTFVAKRVARQRVAIPANRAARRIDQIERIVKNLHANHGFNCTE